VALGSSAFGTSLYYEDFTTDSDTRWVGNGNRSSANNNYGWSNTDTTGTSPTAPSGQVSGAGELAGSIQRGNFSDYGFPTGDLFPTDTLHADGVYQ